jgi:hypothetical protein
MDVELRMVMERVDRVERASFISLYESAPPELRAGLHAEGPVLAAWLGAYDDPGFSFVFDFWLADDPDATLERMMKVIEASGATVMSLDTHPDQRPPYDRGWIVAHGFEEAYDEQIWWRELEGFEPPPLPEGVVIERTGDEDGETFARVLNEGFGDPPDAALGKAFAAVIGKPGWIHYLAHVDGEPGAASALFMADGVADCFVASTRPAARRRGAQTALINRRMADGLAAGCDIATAQSVTDNASPRNFERRGFKPVYRRTIFARRLSGESD